MSISAGVFKNLISPPALFVEVAICQKPTKKIVLETPPPPAAAACGRKV